MLQRRFAFLCGGESGGDFAHLGAHSRCGDNGLAATVHDSASHKNHIFAIAERHVRAVFSDDFAVLFENGDGFARERGFFGFHACALDYTSVCRDGVSRFEHHDVAHNQVFAFYCDLFSVTQHFACGGGYLLQRVDCFFSLAFLHYAENCVDKHDCHNDDDVRRKFAVYSRHNARNHGGDDENYRHRLCKLFEKAKEHVFLFAFGKFVFSVLFKSRTRFGGGKSVVSGADFSKHVVYVFLIFFHKYSFGYFIILSLIYACA